MKNCILTPIEHSVWQETLIWICSDVHISTPIVLNKKKCTAQKENLQHMCPPLQENAHITHRERDFESWLNQTKFEL